MLLELQSGIGTNSDWCRLELLRAVQDTGLMGVLLAWLAELMGSRGVLLLKATAVLPFCVVPDS